ncbi:MAG: replicative DNA helicase [Dehalococcoidia bacterium]|nr:MAG: replicative DNA helicase [Dehalococcoidia bacterium]
MNGDSGEPRSNVKLPPHDLDAEEAVLGSLLIDPEAMFKVVTFLKAEDFYREKNRWTYESCLQLYDRKEAINQITVAHELARQQQLEAAGGAAYLSHLVSQVPTSVHVEYYSNIVRRLSMMRRLISASNQIAAIGYESPPDADDALDRAEGILFGLRYGQSRRDFVHIREVLDRYFEESSLAPDREGFLPHVLTGFAELDKILGGMQRSDMVVLAARPSLGKTSLALNIARNAALDHGARVALFSLEMSKMELAYRFLSCESGIDSQRIRLDILSERQREDIMETMGVLSEAPIYIDDSPFLTDSDMRSKARRLHSEKGIDLIIVDFIQLMRSSRYTDNRVQEMSDISHSIKELARELDVPILAVSQLSRAVEARHPHIPMLSDLRESGSIEQDADVVLFIYREDVYFSEEEWDNKFPDRPYPKGISEIIVAKHRNGPVGRAHLFFRERMAKFENLEKVESGRPSLL